MTALENVRFDDNGLAPVVAQDAATGEVLTLAYEPDAPDLFKAWDAPVRPIPKRDIAFEPAWTEFREGKVYEI